MLHDKDPNNSGTPQPVKYLIVPDAQIPWQTASSGQSGSTPIKQEPAPSKPSPQMLQNSPVNSMSNAVRCKYYIDISFM